MQQISQRKILLGDQIQNMLAWIAAGSLIVLAQRKRVIFRKEWYRMNRQGGDGKGSSVAPPVGLKNVDVKVV